jgi:lactoylglutathione lyase
MRTLHVGLRVADRDRSLAFYRAVGYEVVGEVAGSEIGHLTMLKLPADEFVTLELVDDVTAGVAASDTRLSHLVIQVDSMQRAVDDLRARGIPVATPTSPDGSADFLTTWLVDPDGTRIEVVQWPAGHGAGMSADDFPP